MPPAYFQIGMVCRTFVVACEPSLLAVSCRSVRILLNWPTSRRTGVRKLRFEWKIKFSTEEKQNNNKGSSQAMLDVFQIHCISNTLFVLQVPEYCQVLLPQGWWSASIVWRDMRDIISWCSWLGGSNWGEQMSLRCFLQNSGFWMLCYSNLVNFFFLLTGKHAETHSHNAMR